MATRKISRTFGWILMGLVMVGLVGFGATNFGSSAGVVGKVGDVEIDANRYAREMQSEMSAFEAQTGTQLNIQEAQNFGLDQRVLARLFSTAALEDEVAQLGISVGDDELRKRVVDIPAFQGVDGNFDRDAYSFALEQSGLTAADFEHSLRAEVSHQILQAAVAAGVTIPQSYVDTLYAFARETRDFTWAALTPQQLTATLPAHTAEDLTAYYEARPEAFTLPETKTLTYAWLDPEDVLPSVTVDEDAIRELYEDRASEYNVPERRMVERLIFGTTGEAQAASDAITAGEKSFEDLVADRDLALADIDLGDLSKTELGAAGDAVFEMAEPGVTGPVDSDFGPAIFRMNAILTARTTSFEGARETLHGELAADAARRQIADLVEDLDDTMAGGATLEEIAEAHKMRLVTRDWTAQDSDGIAAYDTFREAAAAATVDDFPEITIMSDGGVFALRVDRLQGPRLQTQAEVADDVSAGWQTQKRRELLAEQAESMIPQLEGSESLASLGLTEIVEQDQDRNAFIEGAPPLFMLEVFEMTPGTWRVIESEENVLLVRLDAVQIPDQNSEDATTLKSSFSAETSQAISFDILTAFSRALQDRKEVVLNRNTLNAVNTHLQ